MTSMLTRVSLYMVHGSTLGPMSNKSLSSASVTITKLLNAVRCCTTLHNPCFLLYRGTRWRVGVLPPPPSWKKPNFFRFMHRVFGFNALGINIGGSWALNPIISICVQIFWIKPDFARHRWLDFTFTTKNNNNKNKKLNCKNCYNVWCQPCSLPSCYKIWPQWNKLTFKFVIASKFIPHPSGKEREKKNKKNFILVV